MRRRTTRLPDNGRKERREHTPPASVSGSPPEARIRFPADNEAHRHRPLLGDLSDLGSCRQVLLSPAGSYGQSRLSRQFLSKASSHSLRRQHGPQRRGTALSSSGRRRPANTTANSGFRNMYSDTSGTAPRRPGTSSYVICFSGGTPSFSHFTASARSSNIFTCPSSTHV